MGKCESDGGASCVPPWRSTTHRPPRLFSCDLCYEQERIQQLFADAEVALIDFVAVRVVKLRKAQQRKEMEEVHCDCSRVDNGKQVESLAMAQQNQSVEVFLMILSCSNHEETFGVCVDICADTTLRDLRKKVVEELTYQSVAGESLLSLVLPEAWVFLQEGKCQISKNQEAFLSVFDICDRNTTSDTTTRRLLRVYARRTTKIRHFVAEKNENTGAASGRVPIPQVLETIKITPFLPYVPEERPLLPPEASPKQSGLQSSTNHKENKDHQGSVARKGKEMTQFDVNSPPRVLRKMPLWTSQDNAVSVDRESKSTYYGWKVGPADKVQPSSCRINSAAHCILARMRSSKGKKK